MSHVTLNKPTLPKVNTNFWPLTLLLINVAMFINLTCPIYQMGIQQEEACYITPVTCKSFLICSVKNQIPCSVCHSLSHERVSLGLHWIWCHLSIKQLLLWSLSFVLKKNVKQKLFGYNTVIEYNISVTFLLQQSILNTTVLLHFYYNRQ